MSHCHTTEDQFDARVAELVLLNSMYPGQLHLDESLLQSQVQSEIVTAQYDHTISGLFLVDKTLEVNFALPLRYPDDKLTVHCRIVDGTLSKTLQKQLNDEVASLVVKGDTLIDILQTILNKWSECDQSAFAVNTTAGPTENKSSSEDREELCRYWIYSHHIYSKVKRKLIVDVSSQLGLTGFMLIGKPGFICLEGDRHDCDNLWSQIRVLSWQRISLVEVETLEQTDHRAFQTFTEQIDRSAVFQFLHTKGCDNIFKNFLGIK